MTTPRNEAFLPVGLPAIMAGVALCFVYAVCVVSFGYTSKIPETMFWYNDSHTYLAVADWIGSGTPTPYTGTRPFLYPLLILLPYRLAGVYGIWCLQTAMWVASGTMLFTAVIRLSRSIWIASAATLFFAANVTLMLLTLHALTEVTAVFLLCLGLTIATGGMTDSQKKKPFYRYSLLLLVAAMLTVVKPVFLYVAIPLMLFQVFNLIGKSRGGLRRYGILLLLAAVSPILIQVGIVKVKHQCWGISDIGQQTLNRYMFAALYSRIEQQPFEQARSEVAKFNLMEMVAYTRRYFPEAIQVWRTLVRLYAYVLQSLFQEVCRGLQVLIPTRLPEDAGH